MKLTDTQLLLLSAASQREDLLLVPPINLKGKAANAVTAKLLRGQLIEEIMVQPHQPHWRESEANRIGFKLTPTGLQAIGIQPDQDCPNPAAADVAQVTDAPPASAARDGSKKALVISLLRREQGATLDDLVAATGWLPHTTRAALTGLRKSGHTITNDKNETGRSVYRLTLPENETSAGQAA
ncbi:DUF3489 domain-containing protein [Microvirga arsenatis]|uniref:DUF3489 domain-containing protein n=1 Tax=Microvirga arsenatis TaxID=2692265 RepID=A0ABW9YZ84_9HYPH|nr:DUF3489 domain-containing protein [Microvirga arsenatis]NBJ10947.1 DUF3489 domain-containing protein [Microvirga arsenatis]NBJ24156.1 DUF3489 domain-containing protein [Microvirga arsenatis]